MSSPDAGFFASRTLTVHLLRGGAALALFSLAVSTEAMPVVSAAAAIAGIVVLRGCPMCWTIGLFQTLAQRRNRPCVKIRE